MARGLVSASVVSRVMAVNSSHVKGGGVARRRQCVRSLERCGEIWQARLAGIPLTTVHKYKTRVARGLPSNTPWKQGFRRSWRQSISVFMSLFKAKYDEEEKK
ncbi:hypothetical protein AVEN_237894-1 [Araneus ventricosus]|uniref:Uncharacterized protein n=1 Tax=Araneus ventricosus TaxID=182803 RepID=A0A4Y2PSF1_ARAVE|nr:hypothetical protein AVEN_237894-1 [Araneus ventricosus]